MASAPDMVGVDVDDGLHRWRLVARSSSVRQRVDHYLRILQWGEVTGPGHDDGRAVADPLGQVVRHRRRRARVVFADDDGGGVSDVGRGRGAGPRPRA